MAIAEWILRQGVHYWTRFPQDHFRWLEETPMHSSIASGVCIIKSAGLWLWAFGPSSASCISKGLGCLFRFPPTTSSDSWHLPRPGFFSDDLNETLGDFRGSQREFRGESRETFREFFRITEKLWTDTSRTWKWDRSTTTTRRARKQFLEGSTDPIQPYVRHENGGKVRRHYIYHSDGLVCQDHVREDATTVEGNTFTCAKL